MSLVSLEDEAPYRIHAIFTQLFNGKKRLTPRSLALSLALPLSLSHKQALKLASSRAFFSPPCDFHLCLVSKMGEKHYIFFIALRGAVEKMSRRATSRRLTWHLVDKPALEGTHLLLPAGKVIFTLSMSAARRCRKPGV